jgi:hypothetical protein
LMGVLTYNAFKNFDVKVGYKFNHVRTTINGDLERPTFLPAHRALLTLDYKTPDQTWLFHVTGHLVGSQRLPFLSGLPAQYRPHHNAVSSPAYINVNAQITKILGRWEIYFGGENLTNYTQHNPIIAPQEPFSDFFNASQVWGPLMGIRGFVGVRYGINQPDPNAPKPKISKRAKIVETTFEVKGECGMCKTRIEKTALAAGAIAAVWSSETHILTVKFDEKLLSQNEIQAAIAKVGHDTGSFKTEKAVYDALPGCCQYVRE